MVDLSDRLKQTGSWWTRGTILQSVKYLRAFDPRGICVFTELLANAGLQSPFDEACLRGVCEEAQRWLKEQKVPL